METVSSAAWETEMLSPINTHQERLPLSPTALTEFALGAPNKEKQPGKPVNVDLCAAALRGVPARHRNSANGGSGDSGMVAVGGLGQAGGTTTIGHPRPAARRAGQGAGKAFHAPTATATKTATAMAATAGSSAQHCAAISPSLSAPVPAEMPHHVLSRSNSLSPMSPGALSSAFATASPSTPSTTTPPHSEDTVHPALLPSVQTRGQPAAVGTHACAPAVSRPQKAPTLHQAAERSSANGEEKGRETETDWGRASQNARVRATSSSHTVQDDNESGFQKHVPTTAAAQVPAAVAVAPG